MRKLIDGLAIASFVLSLTTVGAIGFGYLALTNKTNQEVSELLEELIDEHREEGNLKKIESLEQKLINNLDENSYSELIKLKSQLNRD